MEIPKEVITVNDIRNDAVKKKIEEFYKLHPSNQIYALAKDPTLFSYMLLKDPLNNNNPLEVYPWQDMFLNDKSSKKLLVKSRQIGGSLCICIDILHKISFADTDKTILVFSKGERQAQDIIYKLRLLMRNAVKMINNRRMSYLPSLKVDSKSELYRKNINGTECRVISEVATTSALGHSPSDVYLDEFSYAENDKDFYEHIILPMVSKTKGNTVVLSSPWSTSTYFYHLYKNNPYFKKYHFDYRACPDYNSPEWLEQMRNSMDSILFRSEVLAEFVYGQANQYYPSDLVDSVVSNSIDSSYDSGKTYYIGVDWGQMKSKNVITIISHTREKEINDIEVVEIITAPQNTPYSSIIGEIKSLYQKYKPLKIYCDRGAGQGQIDVLTEAVGSAVIEPVNFTLQSKIDMNSNLKKLMERKEIKIPKNNQLIDELKSFEYEFTSAGHMKLHGEPDDHVDSLALSCMSIMNSFPVSVSFIEKKSFQTFDEKLKSSTEMQLVVCQHPNCETYFKIPRKDFVKGKKYFCGLHS